MAQTEQQRQRTQLTGAFQPETEEQRLAIERAVSLVPSAIPVGDLQTQQQPAILPEVPATPTTDDLKVAGEGALASANFTTPSGAVVDTQGQVVTPPPEPTASTSLLDRIKDLVGVAPETKSRVDEFERLQEQAGIAQKQKVTDDLRRQLAGLTAKQQQLALEEKAIPIRLQEEAAGRGITAAGLAPKQAGELRKLALRQLPVTTQILGVSAQLAAEQGDLDTAINNINTILDLSQQDREARTSFREAQLQAITDIVTGEQKKELEIQKAENARQIQENKDFFALQKIFVNQASDAGDFALAGKLAQATNREQLSALSGQIQIQPEVLSELDRLRADKLRAEIGQIGIGKVKELSSTQRIAAGFAARLEDASKIINEIGDKFTGFQARIGRVLPGGLKTEDRQVFEQAQRNFTNALLRRESGAAIAPSEFESAALQYFPQPGDKEPVLKEKKRNRELVTRALQLEAGEAFAQLRGTLPPIQETVNIGGTNYQVGTIIQNASGQKARVNSDGTLTFI